MLGPQVAHERHGTKFWDKEPLERSFQRGKNGGFVRPKFFRRFAAGSCYSKNSRRFAAGLVVPENVTAASRRGFVGGGRQAIGVVRRTINAFVRLVSFSQGRVAEPAEPFGRNRARTMQGSRFAIFLLLARTN